MKPKLTVIILFFLGGMLQAQQLVTPDKLYGELFKDVQMAAIFPDGKTFVDCIPRKDPELIVSDYAKLKNNPAVRYSLKGFVEANFILPETPARDYSTTAGQDAATHIHQLWKVLQRQADSTVKGSTLLPLPYSYIVPGGRFREIYYWDSYFTMLGLEESNEFGVIENMISNFAYLIDTYGHIPNGNRNYYLSRSQPPFFSMMVALLAAKKGDSIFTRFLPAMEKEYAFWMDGANGLTPGQAFRRVVRLRDGSLLNRYWDDNPSPRQESYLQDVETAKASAANKAVIYRHLRAGAESGWDFSSRWLGDARNLTTIQTTDIIPIDLNCLLYELEMNIATAKRISKQAISSKRFFAKAATRKAAMLKYAWNTRLGFFTDYHFRTGRQDTVIAASGLFPLFVRVATAAQADKLALMTKKRLLMEGGIVTTNNRTGQQWDAPNGWAPLQWVAVKGFENYQKKALCREIATRWLALNDRVFASTGRMMEKYDVVNTHQEAGGGEYPGQDGFGWTNGVYLKLSALYKNKQLRDYPR